MIAFLIICSSLIRVDGYAKQATELNNRMEETDDININSLKEQYEENIRLYGEKYTDILLSEILGFDINDIEGANKDNWYYYNKLDEEQKKVYESVLFNIIKQQEYTFTISEFSKEDIHNFIKYMQYDHVEVFWIDWFALSSLKYKPKSKEYIFASQAYEQFQTIEDIYMAWNKIKEYKEIVLGDTEQLNEKQIEKRIYSYITIHTKYNTQAPMNQSLYSTVLGETVCAGYSKLFKYLCDEAGISCICIFGHDKDGECHLWNIVNLSEQLYMVDCTYGSALYNANEYNLYEYLNCTIDYMNEYYITNEFFKIDR